MNRKSISALFSLSLLTLTISVDNLIINFSVSAKATIETKETSDTVQLLFVQNALTGSWYGSG